MFKKVISILLATVLVVSMTGCSELASVLTSTSEPAVSTSVDKPADNTQTSTTTSVSASTEETQTSASVSEPEPTPEPEPQPEPEPEGYAKYISSPEAWEEMPKEEYDAIDDNWDNFRSSEWVNATPEDTRIATYVKAIANSRYNGEIPDIAITYEMIDAADMTFLAKVPRYLIGLGTDDINVRLKALSFFIEEDAVILTEYKMWTAMGEWGDVPKPHKGMTITEINKILQEKNITNPNTGELQQFQ